MEQKIFNISPIILIKEINKLIKSLPNKKALKLNNMLNKVFKVVALVIKKDLVKIASYYFVNKIILRNLKKSIIIILYKKGKKDYSFLGSYKLITLKNTLAKVLKKYITNIMSKAAKEHRLLL